MARESNLRFKWMAWIVVAVLVAFYIVTIEKLIHIDGNGIILTITSQLWANPVGVNYPNSNTPQGPFEPNFAAYYDPWELAIEPNIVSYELTLDIGLVTNYDQMNEEFGLDQAKELIIRNGFVVIEHDFGLFDPNRDDIVEPYEYLSEKTCRYSSQLIHCFICIMSSLRKR